ncbi:MAG TPA: pitrilysin family protein [Candidatus Sulfotelmatobacter sp.]|nr:pitrilysin family protein [Candidatus Sulfotelmatobacter sp.]
MIRISTLPSGLPVLTEAMPHVRSATIGIWCDVGSATEPAERRGVSHLLEHMVFKGTPRRTARDIAEQMDAVGGELNAMTDKETTCFYAHVVDRHLPLALDVLADMLQRALFAAEDVRRERQVVLEEIRMYDDAPSEVLHDRFTRTLWRGANLGDPTIGFAETVGALEREHLLDWRASRYAPATMFVTAAGNLEHDAVVALVAEAFAGFAGPAQPPVPERPRFTPALDVTVDETEQAYVMLGTPGLSLRDERRYALSLLDTVLGGGMSSRLFQEIREKRGLVYTVYSFQAGYRRAGLFGVYAGTSPENVQECIDVIGEQFRTLRETPVGDEELALAKEHIKGSLTLSLESTSSRMIRLGRNEFALGRNVEPEEIEERIDAVTADEVRELADELLRDEELGLCIIGPVDESAIAWNRDAA